MKIMRVLSRQSLFFVAVLASLFFAFLFSSVAHGATNIDPVDRYAWSDARGWIDFYVSKTVVATSTQLQGYAVFCNADCATSADYISLDCATGPPGSNCSIPYNVSNDGAGNLSGWAWNDGIGWISFSGTGYSVTINSSGDFLGWAWNDVIGWISFNCNTLSPPDCVPSYKVKSSWAPAAAASGYLISSTFDTGFEDGVAYNSIMWLGSLGIGTTSVTFQLATSNCSNGASDPPACTGGGGITGPIDATDKWAWNDIAGWLNFGAAALGTDRMTQWATLASDGTVVALDCVTTPSGNICGASNFFVSNDGNAKLAGWAWHDTYGWISFCGNSSGGSSTFVGGTWVCPASPTYRVTVDTSGNFHGWAWNDTLGWISFNCLEPGVCGVSNYKVKVAGVTGSWNYVGPNGTASTKYGELAGGVAPGVPEPVVGTYHKNNRYYRYKVYLSKGVGGSSPKVEDVIVNWSP